MLLIVKAVGTQVPESFFRLASLTICLVLCLWVEGSAAPGGGAVYTLALPDVPRPWFTLSQQAWESDLMPLLALTDVLDDAMLFGPSWAGHEGAVGTGHLLPALAMATYAPSAVLQFSLRYVFLPLEPLALSPPLTLPFDGASGRRGLRPFMVAQMSGTVLLPHTDSQTLEYALYAGAFADAFPAQLLVGARLRYTFERGEVTVGIDALHSQDLEGRDRFVFLARTAHLPSGEGQMLEILRRMEQDKWVRQDKSPPGLAAGDVSPLGVFIKPVLHLNEHVAVFYRLNHFSLGQGWPKWTEHAVGVRFFPQLHLVIRAEALLTYFSPTSTEAAGFRLSGSLRF